MLTKSTFCFLMCLLLAMWVTLGAAFLTPEPAGGHGMPQGEFGAMLRGGPPPTSRIAFLGWCFGILQIATFVTCMTLGISRSQNGDRQATGRRGWLYVLFGAGSIAYLGVFTQMVWANRTAIVTGTVTYLGPFPAATSWMLFGLWIAPLLFAVAYIVGFSRWIITDDDLSRFHALVEQSRSAETPPSA